MRKFKLEPFGALTAAAIQAHLDLYEGYVEQTQAVRKQLNAPPAAAACGPRSA